MRILLAFLIVLNLLYAGWVYLYPVKQVDTYPPLAKGLSSLQLLHEIKEEVEPAESDQEVVPEAIAESIAESEDDESSALESDSLQVAENTEVKSCFTLGPFKDKNIMQQLRDSIAQHVSDITVRKREESEKHRYWVYMPALKSRAQAKKMARKLREKNLKDFYIVLRGDSKNSISLGHFREPAHANRRMKKVIDNGFKAEINVIYRAYDIYWLDYQLKSNGSVLDMEQDFSIEEYLTDGVSQLVRECEEHN